MLAVYSTLLKKEDVLPKIGTDIAEIANMANDLTCDLKITANYCKEKNGLVALENLESMKDTINILNAMIQNSVENIKAYVLALCGEETANAQAPEILREEKKSTLQEQANTIGAIGDVVNKIKEIQQNLNK